MPVSVGVVVINIFVVAVVGIVVVVGVVVINIFVVAVVGIVVVVGVVAVDIVVMVSPLCNSTSMTQRFVASSFHAWLLIFAPLAVVVAVAVAVAVVIVAAAAQDENEKNKIKLFFQLKPKTFSVVVD